MVELEKRKVEKKKKRCGSAEDGVLTLKKDSKRDRDGGFLGPRKKKKEIIYLNKKKETFYFLKF